MGRYPGDGNGNPLNYYCLGSNIDSGAWQATIHGVAKSWIQLSNKQQQPTPLHHMLQEDVPGEGVDLCVNSSCHSTRYRPGTPSHLSNALTDPEHQTLQTRHKNVLERIKPSFPSRSRQLH